MNEYNPDIVFPPGEILEELLEERGISPEDFAEQLHISLNTLKGIFTGSVEISAVLAEQLTRLLGTPEYIWLNGEKRYREYLAKQQALVAEKEA